MILAVVSMVGKAQKTPPPEPPFLAGYLFTSIDQLSGALHGQFVQADILDGGPDDCQATVLCREHVDLIRPLPYITEETFNRIRGLNVPVQAHRKSIKSQEVFFILS